MGFAMNLDEFMARPIHYSGRKGELELWANRTFKQQMQDIYGEAARLIKQHLENNDCIDAQWDVLDLFCTMTYLSPSNTPEKIETLKLAEWELYDFVFGENVFHNTSESVMRWFNQWVFDINYSAITEE